jgi:hypothetical protein
MGTILEQINYLKKNYRIMEVNGEFMIEVLQVVKKNGIFKNKIEHHWIRANIYGEPFISIYENEFSITILDTKFHRIKMQNSFFSLEEAVKKIDEWVNKQDPIYHYYNEIKG